MSLKGNNRKKSIYPLKRIFMLNLVGIYNKCTTYVLGVSCNGKAQGSFFFFHLQVHDLTNSYFPLHLHSHTYTYTHPQTCTASSLCFVYIRAEPRHVERCCCQHTCVRAGVYMCISFCVYACMGVNTFSCFSSNGPAETCVYHSKVPGCCVMQTSFDECIIAQILYCTEKLYHYYFYYCIY